MGKGSFLLLKQLIDLKITGYSWQDHPVTQQHKSFVQPVEELPNKRFAKLHITVKRVRVYKFIFCTLVGRKLQLPASSQIWHYTMYNAPIKLRESSINMARGDEDIETWSLKF